jgi:hypothetical protein
MAAHQAPYQKLVLGPWAHTDQSHRSFAGRDLLVTGPPAPRIGDPPHYSSFVQRICDRYSQRWS